MKKNHIVQLVHPAKYYRPFSKDSECLISFYDDDKHILFCLYEDDFATYEEVEDIDSLSGEDIFVAEYFDELYYSPNCDYRFLFDHVFYRIDLDGDVTKEVL